MLYCINDRGHFMFGVDEKPLTFSMMVNFWIHVVKWQLVCKFGIMQKSLLLIIDFLLLFMFSYDVQNLLINDIALCPNSKRVEPGSHFDKYPFIALHGRLFKVSERQTTSPVITQYVLHPNLWCQAHLNWQWNWWSFRPDWNMGGLKSLSALLQLYLHPRLYCFNVIGQKLQYETKNV